jgi:hypothetical protein
MNVKGSSFDLNSENVINEVEIGEYSKGDIFGI